MPGGWLAAGCLPRRAGGDDLLNSSSELRAEGACLFAFSSGQPDRTMFVTNLAVFRCEKFAKSEDEK